MSRRSYLRLGLLVPLVLLLAACSVFRSAEEQTPAPPAATTRPTAIGTPPGTPGAGGTIPASSPTPAGPVTLVLWTSEDFAPTSETEGGMRLMEQIQAFRQAHDVDVEVVLKKRSGIGGLLDFLTTASTAAPSLLPDVVTLTNTDLHRAAQAGLLQPLDDLVSSEILDDQFDFARALTRLGDTTMGVLYQADLSHLVYDTTSVKEPPLSWSELYSSTVPFVFSPVAPTDGVNSAILIQYLALAGKLTDDQGRPALDPDRLTQVLEFFQTAQRAGVIPRSVLGLSDATTAWATFRIGEAGMVQVPASLYLAERAGLSNAGFAALPLSSPGASTVGQGWALAVVTQDPERQRLAATLIDHVLAPENSGAWTEAAGRLPTCRSALDVWDQDDVYVPFISALLAQATPAPSPDLATVISGPLTQALAEVLSGQATPAEAAQSAAEAVRATQ